MAENKKDSFTFSDKIKNSKPAVNPFSKRASKIGNNGKPKKTIFDRSRRDTPFFIAAAAALLLLPFLYKYSGTVTEGPIIAPGTDIELGDGLREGFDGVPDVGTVNYTGRDPLELIKRNKKEEEPVVKDSPDDAYVDEYPQEEPKAEEPEPYREAAPQQVRAAVKREPTKINALDKTGLNSRGGNGLPFQFGGRDLKRAAGERASRVPQRSKPVSLQPLRAAGSPSRAYYGQGGAAQARASRAAMGKADAKEALRDAMFAPVGNGRLGGLDGGLLGGGANGGKWENQSTYQPITPWWWDEMKARDHAKWEWNYFLWRRNLVEPLIKKLAEVLGKIGANIACCLVMGKDDCGVDHFVGAKAGSGSPAKCGDMKKEDWEKCKECMDIGPFGKTTCKYAKDKHGKDSKLEWKDADMVDADMNFFQVRANCFGKQWGKTQSDDYKDRFDCEALSTTHNFSTQKAGKISKFKHEYHIVVAGHTVKLGQKSYRLCNSSGDEYNKSSSAGVSSVLNASSQHEQGNYRANNNTVDSDYKYHNENTTEFNSDDCVIYVAEGGIFKWEYFKTQVIRTLEEMYPAKGESLFDALQLKFVEAYAFKDKLTSDGKVPTLPKRYVDFEEAYVIHKGTASGYKTETYGVKGEDGKNTTVTKTKDVPVTVNGKKTRRFATAHYSVTDNMERRVLASDGNVDAISTYCPFVGFRIAAKEIPEKYDVKGLLTFKAPRRAKDYDVTVDIVCDNGQAVLYNAATKMLSTDNAKGLQDYQLSATKKVKEAIDKCFNAEGDGGYTAIWKAVLRGTQKPVSQDDAHYIEGVGNEVTVPDNPPNGCEPEGAEERMTNNGKPTFVLYNGMLCPKKRKCQKQANGTLQWSNWYIVEKECKKPSTSSGNEGPDEMTPTDTPQYYWFSVLLAVSSSPTDVDGRGNRTGRKEFAKCKIEKENLYVLPKDDVSVRQVMEEAKRIFEQKNGRDSMEAVPDQPTVPQVLDAMSILAEAGKEIPKNAVCAVGKSLGYYSTDPYFVEHPNASNNGLTRNNMFGAFAAFMGEESSFYPYLYGKTSARKQQLDKRFNGCYAAREVGVGNKYHYGHYNWNYKQQDDENVQNRPKGRGGYLAKINEYPWKGAPLKALAVDYGWQGEWVDEYTYMNGKKAGLISPKKSVDTQNRDRYWKTYDVEHHMFDTTKSCVLSGTMSYNDVKTYIHALCTDANMSMKPTNGEIVKCGRDHSADQNAVGN